MIKLSLEFLTYHQCSFANKYIRLFPNRRSYNGGISLDYVRLATGRLMATKAAIISEIRVLMIWLNGSAWILMVKYCFESAQCSPTVDTPLGVIGVKFSRRPSIHRSVSRDIAQPL